MSDVTLYPIRGQVAQINGKNEYIVYVPRADKYTYGTVKIGDGLLSVDGVVSLDRSEIPILKIYKNNQWLEPDENKIVHLNLTAADVGLDRVNNTPDEDKPVSVLQQQALDNLKTSVDEELLRLNNLLQEKEQSVAYANYQEVVNVFNMAATNAFNVGQTIYVQSLNVPDLWVYSVENTHIEFAYVGDADIVDTLLENGTVQIGYYKLAMMETKTTDVSNVVTLDTNQTITGVKNFAVGDSNLSVEASGIYLQYKHRTNGGYGVLATDAYAVQMGSVDDTGNNFVGIKHEPYTNTTNITGTLNYNGKEVATKDEVGGLTPTSLLNILEDSDSIVATESDNKVLLSLDATITNKLSKMLVTPLSAPSKTELVAIDDGNSQTMIEIGDGLTLENGVLKSTGDGGGSVDLSDYVKKTDYATSSEAGVVKVVGSGNGVSITSDGVLQSEYAVESDIRSKTSYRKPITPINLDYAVKEGLVNNAQTFSETDKTSVRTLIGAVGNVDYATSSKAGVVKVDATQGITINSSGTLVVDRANAGEIIAKTNTTKPIVPAYLDRAIQVGITTNTISLTDEEKTNASNWLGVAKQDDLSALDTRVTALEEGGTGGSSVTVVDNLNSYSSSDALSARQGKILGDEVFATNKCLFSETPLTYSEERQGYIYDKENVEPYINNMQLVYIIDANANVYKPTGSYLDGASMKWAFICQLSFTLKSEQHVTLTQSEYDALISSGTIDNNTYYYIIEE